MSRFAVGFLLCDSSFRFDRGLAEVVPTYSERARQVEHDSQSDGFIYPPVVMGGVHGRPDPATRRPAHLFRLPASHDLTFDASFGLTDATRHVPAFVMHFLGLLHGVWLQFEDWWFDRRVPAIPRQSFYLTPDEVGTVVSTALATWLSWPQPEQARMINALFMHCRSVSYDWEWEGFAVDYWVTDSLWKTAEALELVSPLGRHAERINVLCDRFGLAKDPDRVKLIVDLRNGLMHEALWDKVQPGTAFSPITIEAPLNLRGLNLRLFLAMLGIRADFIHRGWWYYGTWAFALKP